MINFLLDLFLMFLEVIGIRKRRKKKSESVMPDPENSSPQKDDAVYAERTGAMSCAGCLRLLDKDAVFEQGKVWCTDCYKTHILHIKS